MIQCGDPVIIFIIRPLRQVAASVIRRLGQAASLRLIIFIEIPGKLRPFLICIIISDKQICLALFCFLVNIHEEIPLRQLISVNCRFSLYIIRHDTDTPALIMSEAGTEINSFFK